MSTNYGNLHRVLLLRNLGDVPLEQADRVSHVACRGLWPLNGSKYSRIGGFG